MLIKNYTERDKARKLENGRANRQQQLVELLATIAALASQQLTRASYLLQVFPISHACQPAPAHGYVLKPATRLQRHLSTTRSMPRSHHEQANGLAKENRRAQPEKLAIDIYIGAESYYRSSLTAVAIAFALVALRTCQTDQ